MNNPTRFPNTSYKNWNNQIKNVLHRFFSKTIVKRLRKDLFDSTTGYHHTVISQCNLVKVATSYNYQLRINQIYIWNKTGLQMRLMAHNSKFEYEVIPEQTKSGIVYNVTEYYRTNSDIKVTITGRGDTYSTVEEVREGILEMIRTEAEGTQCLINEEAAIRIAESRRPQAPKIKA